MTRYVTTLEIVKDYFAYRLSNGQQDESSSCKQTSSQVLVSFRKLAYRVENQQRHLFDEYLNKTLDVPLHEKEIVEHVKNITSLVFDDNCVNWGRIVALVSFVAYVSLRYARLVNDLTNATSFACLLIEWLTFFITCKYGIWIECNGGWVVVFNCFLSQSLIQIKINFYFISISKAKLNAHDLEESIFDKLMSFFF